ncbi:MAG: hypothetical protein ABJA70_23870, partial [Chryseolinea sp.]
MKQLIIFAAAFVSITTHAQTLTSKWKTEAKLPVPESVAFDPKTNTLYVACIDGDPAKKDGKGE